MYPAFHTIFCDDISKNARSIFAEMGVDFAEAPAFVIDDYHRADLIWMRKGYRQIQHSLREYQLLNHIPGEGAMVDKGNLTGHLKEFDRTQSMYDLSLSDFYQETYRLYLDDEREEFFSQLPDQDVKDNLWILKPTGLSSGKGVRILWQFDELRRSREDPNEEYFDPHMDDNRKRYIIQRYIKNPLLLQNRKSEIRLYWLIACLDPLLVLLYKEGTARLNSLPFHLDDLDNALVHVTNVYQQKRHPDYDPSLILKWSFSELQPYIADELKLADPNFIEEQLKPQFKDYLSFVVSSTIGSLTATSTKALYFGLYGADLILDDNLHPWLTEVQIGPGLSHVDPVKKRVVPNMLREAAWIVLEVQERKRSGQSLAQLDSVDGFEWVINLA